MSNIYWRFKKLLLNVSYLTYVTVFNLNESMLIFAESKEVCVHAKILNSGMDEKSCLKYTCKLVFNTIFQLAEYKSL